jgi:hypothetical protein
MLVFEVSEFTQNTSKVFNAALTEEVVINNNDGNSYRLLPIIKKGKSPFDNVPRVKLGITTQEIVEIIQECRAGI